MSQFPKELGVHRRQSSVRNQQILQFFAHIAGWQHVKLLSRENVKDKDVREVAQLDQVMSDG